jgi:hypothetical protein
LKNGVYEYVDFVFDVNEDGQLSDLRNFRSPAFATSPWNSNL